MDFVGLAAVICSLVILPLIIAGAIVLSKRRGGSPDASLSQAELRALVADAVAEATVDLHGRIEKLEGQVRRQRRVLTTVAGQPTEAGRLGAGQVPLADSADEVYSAGGAAGEAGRRERI